MGRTMMEDHGERCSVCGMNDARVLVEVTLAGGARATLCGSHAIMHSRARRRARTIPELRELFRERRDRGDRRGTCDELGGQLIHAFSGERRAHDRRRA